jgi:DNA gyrase/topoisomerase IV subunit B
VDTGDAIATDRIINELMGKNASARFRFILDRAEEVEEVDV